MYDNEVLVVKIHVFLNRIMVSFVNAPQKI